ncbi:MAG: CoA transferase [Actinobacteria bacterium]|nr:CoA transferase [Actinomycetota bacterium]
MSTSGAAGPLQGIRIVDLTQALAGPFCTMLLADLGADVVKVEPPQGDMTRFSGPFTLGDRERHYGGYFASINRNKRSVVLDLKTEGGREALLHLLDGADALVENARTGVMDRLGLGYEMLHARNPRLVYGAIRGFGDPRTGRSPYAEWPAYDIVAQAMGGVVGMTGTAEGETVRCGPSVGDIYPATIAAVGIVSALLHAVRTGEGQFVDVAMYDAVLALSEALIYRYGYAGFVTRPTGNGHPQLCPFDVFPAADGQIAIAAPTESHWPVLAALIGRPELASDERCASNRARVANAPFVREVVGGWTSVRTRAEIMETLAGQVPVGPVNLAPDILADPHVAARQMVVELPHPGTGRSLPVAGTPIKLTGTPPGPHRRPPLLGEHTVEALVEAGVDRDHAERLARTIRPTERI